MSKDPLKNAASRFALDMESTPSLIATAVTALSSGVDSPFLRELAGLDERVAISESGKLFQRALSEQGFSLPTKRDAMLDIAADVSRQIINGSVEPIDGAREIAALAARNHDVEVPELDTFVYGESEWDERPEDQVLFVDGIIAAAQSLISDH